MKHLRWYDKNPKLCELFELIQNMDNSAKDNLAQDIIQILINDFELNLDEEINNISKNYTYKCQRWYDYNIDLFSSFEIIKTLPEEMQNKIVSKIVETIWLLYLEYEGAND